MDEQPHLHEANYLKLDSSKARYQLGWQPRWSLETALEKIVDWHQAWQNQKDMRLFSLNQINEYQNTAKS
jgi:CDP-glucose 4,6-dehydratase